MVKDNGSHLATKLVMDLGTAWVSSKAVPNTGFQILLAVYAILSERNCRNVSLGAPVIRRVLLNQS